VLPESSLSVGKTYSYWSRRTNVWLLGFFGILMLADIGVRCWRLAPATRSADALALFAVAFCIVAIWLNYFRHVRQLNQLPEQISDKLVARLSRTAFGMCLIGYLMLLEGLLLHHP
jgi:hypothetical protein